MQTQLPLKSVRFTFDFSTFLADPDTVVECFNWLPVQFEPAQTKIGAIPNNFFFSP